MTIDRRNPLVSISQRSSTSGAGDLQRSRRRELLGWYWNRLRRMSPTELVHRLQELAKRHMDAGSNWCWQDFGNFEGEIRGLPGIDGRAAEAELQSSVCKDAAEIIAGRLRFLGHDWPPLNNTRWWQTNDWFVDPETGRNWPGAEAFVPTTVFRHNSTLGDVKFVWELNRLQFLAQLALAYDKTGEHAIAFDVLEGWMKANPPFKGVNWVSSIEAAIRITSVLLLVALARPPSSALRGIRAFVEAHIQWIYRYPSLYSSANNHRVAELSALFLASICLPGIPKAERIRSVARSGLEREILRQFHSDGVGAEQSSTYTAYSLEWFTLVGTSAEILGEPFSNLYRDRVNAAALWLLWMTDEGGYTPRIGDDDESRVLTHSHGTNLRYPISVAAFSRRWLGQPEPDMKLRNEELRDFIFARNDRPAWNSKEFLGVKTFPKGGYTVSRTATSKGLAHFVFDHGPIGFSTIAAHGHADALSIWFSWGPEPIFVDAGTFLYHASGEGRDYYRSTKAHNTLSIQGSNQSTISGPFMWSQHASSTLLFADRNIVTAEHDGYRTRFGITHRRSLAFIHDGYDIDDQLFGGPRFSDLRWEIGFTLAPGIRSTICEQVVQIETPLGRRIDLASLVPSLVWTRDEVPYSPSFGVEQRTIKFALSGAVGGDGGTVSRVRIVLCS